jgi:hypothetical protein
MPEFSGTYEELMPFREIFQALIDNIEGLTDLLKLYYLRATQKQEAARIIHSLQLSSQNYRVAWNLLEERYDNKRMIIIRYVNYYFSRLIDRRIRKSSSGTIKHHVEMH